jgi:transposase
MTRTTRNSEIVITARPRRQHRSKQERRQIVEETLEPGASVAIIARSHGVNANQVFQWRKLYREGRLDAKPAPAQLVPVRITEMASEQRLPQPGSGVIHIELGRVRVRIEGSVDPATLCTVLERIGR